MYVRLIIDERVLDLLNIVDIFIDENLNVLLVRSISSKFDSISDIN